MTERIIRHGTEWPDISGIQKREIPVVPPATPNTQGGILDPELESSRIAFFVTLDAAGSVKRRVDTGETLTAACNYLIQMGLALTDFMREAKRLEARDIATDINYPYSPILDLPVVLPDSQMIQRFNVATHPETKAAIVDFCDSHDCLPDVGINALIDRGEQLDEVFRAGKEGCTLIRWNKNDEAQTLCPFPQARPE